MDKTPRATVYAKLSLPPRWRGQAIHRLSRLNGRGDCNHAAEIELTREVYLGDCHSTHPEEGWEQNGVPSCGTGGAMANRIEDYAVIGNCETIALVGRDGSVDWLGLPRFDSAACLASLLGEPQHGRWLIAPTEKEPRVTRRYRGDTLILETTFETGDGVVCVIDFMTRRDGVSDVIRLVSIRTQIGKAFSLRDSSDAGRQIAHINEPGRLRCGDLRRWRRNDSEPTHTILSEHASAAAVPRSRTMV
jgi:hypothetical protein